MGKKKHSTSYKKTQNQQNNLSLFVGTVDEKILTQAIVNAHQIIEENRRTTEEKSKVSNKKIDQEKWYIKFLFILNVLCFPWKINKRFTINNQIYDSILVLFVSLVLRLVGAMVWFIGICVIGYDVVLLCQGTVGDAFVGILGVGILSMMFGSLFTLAGDEFSKVSDSNRIYAYSASIIALISCVVAIVSLIKQFM